MAPMAAPGIQRSMSDKRERRDTEEQESDLDSLAMPAKVVAPQSSYLTKLADLARMLERADVRIVRQRLAEWIEDLRSVGGDAALAAPVEQLVQRLATGPTADELRAIAAELLRLANGGAPTSPPKPSGRSFWK